MVLILLLLADINLWSCRVPLPETSREFAHYSLPILTSEIGYNIADLALDYLKPDMDYRTKYLVQMASGLALTIAVFNSHTIAKHYGTYREWELDYSGRCSWFVTRLTIFCIRLPLWHKWDKQNAEIKGWGLIEIPKETENDK